MVALHSSLVVMTLAVVARGYESSLTFFNTGTREIGGMSSGSDQYWTVPQGVTEIQVKAWGAAGGAEAIGANGFKGGQGGFVEATLPVTPGAQLTIVVGDGGRSGNVAQAGVVPYGYGGIGRCASSEAYCTATQSRTSCITEDWESLSWGREVGDGGGLSGVFNGSPTRENALIIAGGGGGASDAFDGGHAWDYCPCTSNCAMSGAVGGAVRTGGGGGGYCGGTADSQGNVRGGSNFIASTGVNTVNKGGSYDLTSDSDYITRHAANRYDIALSNHEECRYKMGGDGMVIIKWNPEPDYMPLITALQTEVQNMKAQIASLTSQVSVLTAAQNNTCAQFDPVGASCVLSLKDTSLNKLEIVA